MIAEIPRNVKFVFYLSCFEFSDGWRMIIIVKRIGAHGIACFPQMTNLYTGVGTPDGLCTPDGR